MRYNEPGGWVRVEVGDSPALHDGTVTAAPSGSPMVCVDLP